MGTRLTCKSYGGSGWPGVVDEIGLWGENSISNNSSRSWPAKIIASKPTNSPSSIILPIMWNQDLNKGRACPLVRNYKLACVWWKIQLIWSLCLYLLHCFVFCVYLDVLRLFQVFGHFNATRFYYDLHFDVDEIEQRIFCISLYFLNNSISILGKNSAE